MDAQTASDARIIRESLNDLGAWVGIWRDDVAHGLPCTPSSLILAKSHIDNALAALDRMQSTQRAAA